MSDKKIENLLRVCLTFRPGNFVYSVTRQYMQKGTLSEKQIAVLEKIAGEIRQSIDVVKEC